MYACAAFIPPILVKIVNADNLANPIYKIAVEFTYNIKRINFLPIHIKDSQHFCFITSALS